MSLISRIIDRWKKQTIPQWIPESHSHEAAVAADLERLYGVEGVMAVSPETIAAYTAGYVSGKNAVLIQQSGMWSPDLAKYVYRDKKGA